MKRSRTENSLLNIFVGLGGYAVNTILGLVCRMVFTRTLAADYLGVSGLFSNILSMLSLAELGISTAIVYALYKPLAVDDKDRIATLVKFYGKCYRVIGCVVAVIGLALTPFLDLIINVKPNISENLYVIYLLYIFNTSSTYFFSYRASLLTAAQQNYLVTGLNYVITISQSVIQMGLLFLTHNFMLYLLVQTAGTFIYNILISYITKKKYPYIVGKNIKPLEKQERGNLIKNVKALIVIKISGILVNHTDNIIITYFGGLITVGLASNYILLSTTLTALLSQIFTGINASIGNHNALETTEKKKSLFYSVNLAQFWLYGLVTVGIAVMSSDIVALLFGTDYVLGPEIPFIIALNFYILGMQSAVWTYKNTLGLFRPGRYLLFLTAAINLGASIYLGNIWGLFGVYIATAISRLLTNVWYEPYAVFKYGFKQSVIGYYLRYIVFVIVLVLCGGICYFLCGLLQFNLLVNIILEFMICIVVCNGVFWLLFHKRSEFEYIKKLVNQVIKMITKKVCRS